MNVYHYKLVGPWPRCERCGCKMDYWNPFQEVYHCNSCVSSMISDSLIRVIKTQLNMNEYCKKCYNEIEECTCNMNDEEKERYQQKFDELKRKYPGYRDENYGFGAFLGLDFPYVPGDPGI